MPCYSERKLLIQDLQFLLVTTFANLETEKPQHKITPPHLQTSALYLCLLGLLNKTDACTNRMIFLSGFCIDNCAAPNENQI
jgi:hypothetical protein